MGGGIYLVQDDGGLVEINEQGYASEDRLQELLASYPNLLAGIKSTAKSLADGCWYRAKCR